MHPHVPRTVVVALHSSGANGRQWRPLAAALGADADVIAPDLAGHGGGVAARPRHDIVADDIAFVGRLMATHSAVHLVGHSYGGAIALEAALRHPSRVASVTVYEPVLFRVLFDRYRRGRPAAEVHDLAARIGASLRAHRHDDAAAMFVDYWSGGPAFAAMDAARRVAIASRMPVIAAHFAGLARLRTRAEGYAAIAAPVTLLSGQRTRASTRRIVELIAGAMPSASRQAMSAMGHLGPLTHPAIVAQRIAFDVRRAMAAAAVDARRAA